MDTRAAIAPVEETALESKSTLLVRNDRTAPRVAVSLLVRVGAADETSANSGWRQVLTNAVLQATQLKEQDSFAIEDKEQNIATIFDWQRILEPWGGELGATVDDDAIEFWIVGDSARTDEFLQILLQIVQNPRFADENFTAARREILSLQDQAKDDTASLAVQALAEQLYRDSQGNPIVYALPDYGSFESLSNLDDAQLRAQHERFFTPDRFTFSVAGDADPKRIAAHLNRLIKKRPSHQDSVESVEQAPKFATRSKEETPPLKLSGSDRGSWIFAAYRVLAPNELTPAQLAAFEVLSAALVGSSQARLTKRLLENEQNSLATQAGSQWLKRRFASELTLFAQTDDPQAVRKVFQEEIALLGKTPLSSAELQSAKNYARGQWSVSRGTLHERSFTAALAWLHSSTPDSSWPKYFQEVSAEQVREVARQYLSAPATVILSPQE